MHTYEVAMGIKAINHITINVKKLEETKKFYGELLGLKELPPVVIEGVQTVYYYELPGNVKLELIDYEEDIPESVQSELAPGSCRHFAFEVDDIYGLERKLADAGYKFHLPVGDSKPFGCIAGLVLDPNGFELEFVQY